MSRPVSVPARVWLGAALHRKVRGLLKRVTIAGKHELERRVLVAYFDRPNFPHILADLRHRVSTQAEYRHHATRVTFCGKLHRAASHLNHSHDIGERADTGRIERRVFPDTVAGNDTRDVTFLPQDLKGDQTHQREGGLSVVGLDEGSFRVFETQAREVFAQQVRRLSKARLG